MRQLEMKDAVRGAYCSKRKEWFQGPSSEPNYLNICVIIPKFYASMTAYSQLTKHNIASTDKDYIEIVRARDSRCPMCEISNIDLVLNQRKHSTCPSGQVSRDL